MPSFTLPELIGIATLVVFSISVIMPGVDRTSRRFFLAFYLFLILNAAVFAFDMATYKKPEFLAISKCLPLIEYLLLSLPAMLLTIYLLRCYGEPLRRSPLFRFSLSLWVIYVILQIIAKFTDIFYYTASDGTFYVNKWNPVLFLPLVLLLIINLVTLIIKRKKLSKRYFLAFLFCLPLMTVALIIHAFYFAPLALNIALTFGSLAMYVLILTDHIDQNQRQQEAIANQQASILVLQMRPHFVYNTMTSIYYLCEQDPKKAQQVILDFTSYLRKNFNAIAHRDLISFIEELEHVRAYLAVEIAQFEDMLSVEYDIPHTHLLLPPLTLQPLVENSIKYGMDPDGEPLHILIQTREIESGSMILVKDNGPGFDPAEIFDKPNALSNIRQRLEMMCHGSITITSSKGEGTIVRIVIPNRPTAG